MKSMYSKFVATAVMAVATLVGGASAQATTISDWITAGDLFSGNLKYTFISTTLGGGNGVSLFSDGASDDYITISAETGTSITDATLEYSVTVLDPHLQIVGVDANVTLLGKVGGLVEKLFSDGTTLNTTANGGFDAKSLVGGPTSTVSVLVTVTTNGSIVTSFGDSYHLSAVPEPSTFALLGLGGAGLAFRFVRRRQTV